MTIVKVLDQAFVDTQLYCPPGKARHEIVDPQRTGLYIEVRSSNPRQGTYYVRYKDAGKKTCHEKLGRTTELPLDNARAAAIRFKTSLAIVDRAPGLTLPPSGLLPATPPISAIGAGSMTLDVFMKERYFPHAKVHKRSVARDEQLYRLRIKPKFGHLLLKEITRLAVQQFQYALVAEGLANASVNQHVQLLRRVCNLAVSWEMLEKNVLTRIPLLPLDNQVENYLDDEQVTKLVAVLKTDDNRMVSLILTFLLATGARLNEALCAEWKQVNAARTIWTIPATNSKSKKLKHLPLNQSARWVIEQLDVHRKSELLFPSPITGKPFTTITRQWYRIRKKAGIPANVRIHDLRHTFASRMVSAGRSLFDVQNLLGHADARTSQRYAHLSMKAAQEASNAAAFALT